MKKSLILSVTTIFIVVVIVSVPFLANSKSISPEQFVKEYLELNKKDDYEKLSDIIIDDRFNNDRQTEIEQYKKFAQEKVKVKDFKIKKVREVTEDKATVITEITFEDGRVNQTPVKLVKQDGEWKVHIGTESATDDKDFKRIK
ncbi:hypothetical protein A8F95_02430 [Bacillus wudalianchiensis]|uniref:Uncharacterized protein n=2 Tax=Pseudobacillus wudalianchiensis TaxID=1743143 RepID=A0A1B9B924_9BACI|nr:hypothetical protein A8F95_02430 [Bacillus wudalianchiensis]